MALARLILDGAPACRLLVARVFFDRLHTTPRQVAAAIDWLGEAGAAVINLSLGLTANRSVLEDACRAARDRGQLLVASSPARGPVPYPAAYPGVIRVTGDARCRPGELSALNSWQADFGACVAIRGGGLAGASLATARVTAAIAALLAEGTAATPDAVRAALTARAAYHGPEQRSAADPAG